MRVLATTNRDLLQAVKEGEFREDLYYRLNVFPIQVPPLRKRGEDILLLAEAFLSKFSRQHNLSIPGFTPEAESTLMEHNWPDNVRELQNTIERSVILHTTVKPSRLNILLTPFTSMPIVLDPDPPTSRPTAPKPKKKRSSPKTQKKMTPLLLRAKLVQTDITMKMARLNL